MRFRPLALLSALIFPDFIVPMLSVLLYSVPHFDQLSVKLLNVVVAYAPQASVSVLWAGDMAENLLPDRLD